MSTDYATVPEKRNWRHPAPQIRELPDGRAAELAELGDLLVGHLADGALADGSLRAVLADPVAYAARWPELLGQLAGLVVVTHPAGYVACGTAREIRQAMATRRPIVVLARWGLPALADCAIVRVPDGEAAYWRELLIVPPESGAATEALQASLRAIGVEARPKTPGPSRVPSVT
jgi:hypothetical protein